jgi:hypothetical protein
MSKKAVKKSEASASKKAKAVRLLKATHGHGPKGGKR